MDQFFSLIFSAIEPTDLAIAFVIALFAGTVKGMVGFALPMILVSGLSLFLAPELALAGLILPTLVTNGMQALRQGVGAAFASLKRFWIFLLAVLICLLLSAQTVRILPQQVMFLLIGVPVTLFVLLQLLGLALTLAKPTPRVEVMVGAFAGMVGGVSGVWGPPTVAYLTALNLEKSEQIRVQGVIYGIGAVTLFLAHIGSGVIRSETLPFSILLVLPAVVGMWLGGRLHDRIDQKLFKQATLIVLLVAGLNLVRRGLMG
ncbi:sulfite exporter TauE/SafE family protein [Pseudophaeobacter flagellatus]|uniref:sulfite exporter TauE/SafE family protein n=1 Tax=Pseudophaeobacter flagellatus TaxID=2899119 RepID=UPI001E542694|nr:sulfite exporter TauE/SafE family protein [Pseudophaeobacter flagellatus]MCD9149423.1 sulfite exporter TauE/SafE family protein [Pseudophaeobacter flagellatus]